MVGTGKLFTFPRRFKATDAVIIMRGLTYPLWRPSCFFSETRSHNSTSIRGKESCPNEGARPRGRGGASWASERASKAAAAAVPSQQPMHTHPQPQTGAGGHTQAQLAAAQKQASKRRKEGKKEGEEGGREGRREAPNPAEAVGGRGRLLEKVGFGRTDGRTDADGGHK